MGGAISIKTDHSNGIYPNIWYNKLIDKAGALNEIQNVNDNSISYGDASYDS
jgi:hypothetical protein